MYMREFTERLNDAVRRIGKLERLEVPSLPSFANYFGTPIAGNYAYWTGAGTVADSGFGTGQLPRYSGTPVANALAYWTGAGTVAGDRLVYVSSAGSVSIGTVAPATGAVLDMLGSLNGVLKGRLTNSNANSGAYASYQLLNNVSNIGAFFLLSSTNGNYAGTNSFNMVNAGAFPLGFGTNDTIRVIIDANGVVNVGALASVGANILGVKAGTSTNDAAVGGVLYVDSGTNANGTTVETDLSTYTVPANTLAVNNQSLIFEAWGTMPNNSNTHTIKLKFGSDVVTLYSNNTAALSKWYVKGTIVRTGAATQDYVITAVDTANLLTTVSIGTMTRTLSSSNVLKFTGQGGATNDVVQEGFKVRYDDANT